MLKKGVSNSRVFPLSVSLKIQYMKQLAQK